MNNDRERMEGILAMRGILYALPISLVLWSGIIYLAHRIFF